MRLLIAIIGLSLFAAKPLLADESRPAKTAPSNLDDELLKGLDNDLLDGLDPRPAKRAEKPAATKPETPRKGQPSDLDEELLKSLGEGEDVGEKSDLFAKLSRRMRAVEELIGKQDTSSRTQKEQQKIVEELTTLIAELQKQCQGKCQSPGSQSSSKPSENKTGDGKAQANRQPLESTDRVEKGRAEASRAEELKGMLKEVWGQLPDRVRTELENPNGIKFLPKYERLIEEYYKRLAEERR